MAVAQILGVGVTAAPPSTVTIRAGDTIVMLGDSITSTTYTYYQAFKDYVDGLVAGLTWVNCGVSGSGLIPGASQDHSTDASIASEITPNNPHVLFIELGANCVIAGAPWDPSLFLTRLRLLITKALAAAPNLARSRILVSSIWFAGGEPTSAANDPAANQCLSMAMDAAVAERVAFLDQRTPRVRTGSQTVEGIHPTATGKTNMCNKLIAATTLVP